MLFYLDLSGDYRGHDIFSRFTVLVALEFNDGFPINGSKTKLSFIKHQSEFTVYAMQAYLQAYMHVKLVKDRSCPKDFVITFTDHLSDLT